LNDDRFTEKVQKTTLDEENNELNSFNLKALVTQN